MNANWERTATRERENEEAREATRRELEAKYPYLEPARTSKKTPWALAAANIRRELKRVYPGVKFSVKSDAYSMGCSVDITCPAGVDPREVEAAVKSYQKGTFDGMTDSYEYNDGLAKRWCETFGGASFVHAQSEH